jgi:hypothetical protein
LGEVIYSRVNRFYQKNITKRAAVGEVPEWERINAHIKEKPVQNR